MSNGPGDPIWHVDDTFTPTDDFWYRTLEGNLVGVEIGLWLSNANSGLPRDRWDLNPIIVLGGQDPNTNEPIILYTKLLETFGADTMEFLQQQFDFVVMTYWTAEGNQETIGEARELGLRRSLPDNALLVADALYFLYSQAPHGLNVSRKSAFIGISMGGLVSRLAFLGIEQGIYPQPMPELTVNFPQNTVPIRLWVTLDAPHQGAYIPVALQEMVDGFRFLPPLESTRLLLSAQSSKEMLIDHFEGYNARVNAEFQQLLDADPPSTATPYGYHYDLHRRWKEADLRNLHAARKTLLATLQDLGGFPQTVECSVAVASGALSPATDAPYLWKLDSQGQIPWNASYGRDGEDDVCTTKWTVDGSSLSMISQQTSVDLRTYNPLGPVANPLQRFELALLGFNSANFEVTVSVTSLLTELTYIPWSSWYQFSVPTGPAYADYRPYPEYNPEWQKGCPTPWSGGRWLLVRGVISESGLYYLPDYRAFLEIVANGAIKVNIPGIGDFPLEYHIDLAATAHPQLPGYPADPTPDHMRQFLYLWNEVPYQKPKAYEAGSFLETVRTISSQIEEVIGPISSLSGATGIQEATDYLPRHCFIPTISALDLYPNFLRAAWWRYQLLDSWQVGGTDLGGMTRYWRNTVRSLETGYPAYFQEDFLDYDWVRQYLGISMPGLTNIWKTTNVNLWTPYEDYGGKASPFDYLVVQDRSLEHVAFDLRTGQFLVGRLLAPDCDTQPSLLPLQELHLRSHWKTLPAWQHVVQQIQQAQRDIGNSPITSLGDLGILRTRDEETTTEAQLAPLEQMKGLLPPASLRPFGERRTRPDEKKLLAQLGLERSSPRKNTTEPKK